MPLANQVSLLTLNCTLRIAWSSAGKHHESPHSSSFSQAKTKLGQIWGAAGQGSLREGVGFPRGRPGAYWHTAGNRSCLCGLPAGDANWWHAAKPLGSDFHVQGWKFREKVKWDGLSPSWKKGGGHLASKSLSKASLSGCGPKRRTSLLGLHQSHLLQIWMAHLSTKYMSCFAQKPSMMSHYLRRGNGQYVRNMPLSSPATSMADISSQSRTFFL